MNIVCFGQQNWDVSWVTRQQLLSRLARRGHRVMFVDPVPTGDAPSVLRALQSWRNCCEVTQVQDGLHVITPRRLPPLPRALAARLRWRTVRHAAEHLGLWAPAALCLWPAQRWLMDAVDPVAKLYFAEDDSAAFGDATPADAEHRRREEQKLLEECDAALAVSHTLLERFAKVQPNSFLQENGVELEQFTAAALDALDPHPLIGPLPRPRLGYVGQIDERFDQDLVVAVARRFPRAAVVLAGRVKRGVDVSRLHAEPNIHFTGFVDYRQLGSVYRELDVGLVPFVSSPLTAAGNPLKIYEYLAADLPTVATEMCGLNSTRPAIEVAPTHEQFLGAVGNELRDPDRLAALRRRVAESASWQRRADQLEDRLNQALAIAAERRRRRRHTAPRPDRHGRQAVGVEPRLDGKDASVRLLHNDYIYNGLSPQQHLMYLLSRAVGLAYHGVRRLGRILQGDSSAVRRILVVRNGHLGDTVVFLPTLAALRRKFPKATITVALAPGSGAQPLLEATPEVDEVMPLDFFNRSRMERFRRAARLLAHGFDLSVGGVWYFHLPEAVFSGAPRRLGLYDGHPLQRYADRVMMLDPFLHEAENNLRLVELITGAVPLQDRIPELNLDQQMLARKAADMRQRLGLAPEAAVVAIHPGSKRPSRRWPAQKFAELSAALLKERPTLQIVFTGAGREESELIDSIRGMIRADLRGRTHNGTGVTDLLGVIGFYDTCKLLICNDTGVMHVARARGVPLVAIIGPENDRRWGPHPLGPGPAVSVRRQVPGTPHGKWDCPWNLSLQSIDAARIKHHSDAMLDGTFAKLNNVQVIEAEGRRYFPLVRDVRRLSFAQLQEMGLRLPKVAVVIPVDPALLGGEGEASSPEALAAAARSMRRQLYPALNCLLVVDEDTDLESADVGQANIIVVPRGDPDAAWAAVLAHTSAALFWPTLAGAAYGPTTLSSRVGVYLRGPHATVTDDERAWPARTLIETELLSGRWLIERGALEDLLEHPLAAAHSPAAVAEDEALLEPAMA